MSGHFGQLGQIAYLLCTYIIVELYRSIIKLRPKGCVNLAPSDNNIDDDAFLHNV